MNAPNTNKLSIPTAVVTKPVAFSTEQVKFQPPRLILNAVEKWGKTSMASYTPNAAILMARGETGYLTLLGAGLVPLIPYATIESWQSLLSTIDDITANPTCKTLVLDAMNGFARLCDEYVCETYYKNNWSDQGFFSFQKGFDTSAIEWGQLLMRLDQLNAKGVMIFITEHLEVSTYKNPLGNDYDRFTCSTNRKSSAITKKWADALLVGKFLTLVDAKGDKKGKGIGGTERVLYTQHSDAMDAGNRYSMPPMMSIPDDPKAAWELIWSNIYRKDNK